MYDEYSIQIVCSSSKNNNTQVIPIQSSKVREVKSILDLGLRHAEQIELLQIIQDQILKLQSPQLREDITTCHQCGSKLNRNGYTKAEFHSVFTDHKVPTVRQRCCNKNCKWASVPSIKSLLGTTVHPDLAKLQCEIGAAHTYREAQSILNKKSACVRKINNHESVHHVIESVGQYISDTIEMESVPKIPIAEELIAQIDGGHIKDKSPEKRSFEAMTAVIYQPGNTVYSIKAKDHRGKILSKHCAASTYDDEQKYMKKATLVAAHKQGLGKITSITALCDGASNCWNIVDSLAPHCASITRILDWFHIAMRFQNTRLGDDDLNDRLAGAKWFLWHGNVEEGLERLSSLYNQLENNKQLQDKIETLKKYIENNAYYIIDYEKRKNAGLIFTSQLAESTVESLINKRCKGHQHMRWTREGAHPLLQVRAYIASNDWESHWQEKVLGAITKAA